MDDRLTRTDSKFHSKELNPRGLVTLHLGNGSLPGTYCVFTKLPKSQSVLHLTTHPIPGVISLRIIIYTSSHIFVVKERTAQTMSLKLDRERNIISKLDSDSGSTPVAFFCLYRLIEATSNMGTGTSSPHSSLGPSAFTSSSFSSQSDGPDGADLEVISSDLHEELDKQLKLKKHILAKITKNMSYESGSILLLPTIVLKNKVLPPTRCYWNVLKGKDSRKYILCLISASESEGFNLYAYHLIFAFPFRLFHSAR